MIKQLAHKNHHPKRHFLTTLLLIGAIATILVNTNNIYAKNKCDKKDGIDDKLECYQKKIEDKQEQYQSTKTQLETVRATKEAISEKIHQMSQQLQVTQADLDSVAQDIQKLEKRLSEINETLKNRKEALSQKETLRNNLIRTYAKQMLSNDMEILLTTKAGLSGFKLLALTQSFNKSLEKETLRIISTLNTEINTYEADKKEAEDLKNELETQKNNLQALANDLKNRKQQASSELNTLKKKEDTYENELQDLEKEISELTQKQQSILSAKYGTGNGTVGDYEPPEAKTPDPPFKPAFAVFSYGAYTHYNGMSQYGAKGRAEDGKNYKEIIKFYYGTSVEKKNDFPKKINVQGYGEMDFQKYLYGIAEMPSDWPMEALKAQAIAARTFAYRSAKPICTTQACQVFLKSKSDNPPSRWKKAVDETKNKILKDPRTSQYSSTTGGYINNVGWDAKGKWPKDAYERKAGSPWFYKAWYTKSYNNSDSCGHPHPWLSEKEMADILNAWVVWRKGTSDEKDRISPVTTKCWGGNPYSIDKMRKKADKYGEGYKKVTDVDVEISNSGYTSKVTLTTDRGKVSIDGQTFKTVFNLRAPGYVAIRSRLFDIERRK